ncbi:MAG: transketolase [Verrucomicrobiales bacterium]|nr:transketolase [Verrucomicrobiales bacterium]
MRTAFIQALIEEARRHPRVFLVVGDLGFSVVEPFAKEFPSRFLNAGVAEQNMTAVAAGLAAEGWHPFTYSIANFPTLRCLEQIRNDVCYHRLPVTVVAVGAGLAYGNMGYSHHGVQDLAVMRALPNLTVLSPADPGETTEAVAHLTSRPGPSYLRLGKAGEKTLHATRGLAAGPLRVRDGSGPVALVATGSILAVALAAAERRGQETGSPTPVFSCPWIKPVTADFFAPLWAYRRLVTLEEHVPEGGLGEMLAGLAPAGVEVRRLALSHEAVSKVGTQEYLRQASGLTVESALREVARE